ncbi:MAG: type II toxin-antitoxin system RelE/ParE family toxin [Burkholderiales bacterium]|nr:type II toxin-antitoxin system RelE/ParE family toxin [Burkholderiales bacterium]MDE2077962.1 type II toxin-antitoxin system RelE/ParE family toxin [Burkholderiales bacterium]MDE2433092.1 type II toxin-antitoxin system RelE/ParE family toxin [Burkholderiales bacterium]
MEIKWTSCALGDLARLYEFLSPVNPRAAAVVFEKLTAGPDILETQPRIGTPLTEFLPREVRYLLVGDYEMRYEITQDSKIWILRVWHTREDR